jgi:2-polyprenyl-3-methyl-5-hydroxy-6-metoxy-1,4-benzoquinol methylase
MEGSKKSRNKSPPATADEAHCGLKQRESLVVLASNPIAMSTTPVSINDTSKRLYFDAVWLVRLLQRGRPYICPFDPMVEETPTGASVLDIGCGSGLFALHLVNAGRARNVLGIDQSPKPVAAARRAQTHLPPERQSAARFEVMESFHQWPDEQFDAVSMIDMMHHVPPEMRKDLFLAAAERVAPGGVLIYKDMRRRPRWRAAMNQLHDLILARQWITHCPAELVLTWGAEGGLTVTRRSLFDKVWYAHELIVFRK